MWQVWVWSSLTCQLVLFTKMICWGQSSPQVPPGFVGCTKEEQGCKGPNTPAPGSSPMALGYFRAV